MAALKEKAVVEAGAVADFLTKIEDMRFRRTQLLVENPKTRARVQVNSEYVLGK